MTRVFTGERTSSRPCSPRSSAGSTALPASTRARSSTGSAYARRHAGLPRRCGFLLLYALLRLQDLLPLNPAEQAAVAPDLAFNTATSFVTNTNWQNYGGETHALLPVADAGADAPELPVGRHRHRAGGRADPRLRPRLGPDGRLVLGRSHPLHPLRAAAALRRLHAVPGLAGHAADPRRLRRRDHARGRASRPSRSGPVASQVAIKMLGTNGGGFFNANAAHPFENPDRAVELRPDRLDLRARRRAHQRLRPHGRRRAPGLGDPRRDGRPVPGRRRGHVLRPRPRAARSLDGARARPAATWRARRSASASSPPRCSR